MCSTREKKMIERFNRVVVCIAGIAGVLVDGYHNADLLALLSMMIWLWQPECSVIEEKCFDQLKHIVDMKNKSAR